MCLNKMSGYKIQNLTDTVFKKISKNNKILVKRPIKAWFYGTRTGRSYWRSPHRSLSHLERHLEQESFLFPLIKEWTPACNVDSCDIFSSVYLQNLEAQNNIIFTAFVFWRHKFRKLSKIFVQKLTQMTWKVSKK